MVVSLRLDDVVNNLLGERIPPDRVVRGPEVPLLALKNSGVVAVGGDGEVRSLLVSILDHLKERFAHRHTVNGPGGVESVVATMPIQLDWLEIASNILEIKSSGYGAHTRS